MFYPCLDLIQVLDCITLSSWGWAQSGATVALSLYFNDTVQEHIQLTTSITKPAFMAFFFSKAYLNCMKPHKF